MQWVFDDGGRGAAGYKGEAGDCVCRAIAIAAQLPYAEVYEALADGMAQSRKTKRACSGVGKRSARNGVAVKRQWFKDYMQSLGWKWTATMTIGSGCKVHLSDNELPAGRLIVSVSRHYTAVINGIIHDTYDPQREAHVVEPDTGRELRAGEWRNANGICRVARRCVYGYWSKPPN